MKLLNHVTEKKKKLSLQDYLCRKDNGQFDMVDFNQDNFSIVKLYKHIEKYHMPAEETGIEVGRFFGRHASNKEMKVCLFFYLFNLIRLLTFASYYMFISCEKKQVKPTQWDCIPMTSGVGPILQSR